MEKMIWMKLIQMNSETCYKTHDRICAGKSRYINYKKVKRINKWYQNQKKNSNYQQSTTTPSEFQATITKSDVYDTYQQGTSM